MKAFNLVLKTSANQVLAAVHALVFSIITTRELSPDLFGDLRFVLSLLPVLMVASLPTYDNILLRNSTKFIFTPLYKVTLLRVTGGVLASISILLYLFIFDVGDNLWFFLIITSVLLPFFETFTGYRNFLIGSRLKKQSINSYMIVKITSIGLFLLFYALTVYYELDKRLLLLFYFLSSIIPTVIVMSTVMYKQWNKQRYSKIRSPQMNLSSAIVTSLAAGIMTLSFSLDKMLIHDVWGAESLAFYAILIMFPLELAKLVDAVFPLFYRKVIVNNIQVGLNKLVLVGISFLVIGVIYSSFAYLLFPIVFGTFYTYDFTVVLVSFLLVISGVSEYYVIQKMYINSNYRLILSYALVSLFCTYGIMSAVLPLSSLIGVIIAVFFRQITQSLLFLRVC
ncbi:hypothetical protein AAFX24_20035 [Vibrio mediterranei]|jgi:O-antigen/teichoic acid export membrane protein|uniref:Lipopolysaccharide biosynthesis protein n=1 Tax=Vibrio mediterranei TaxID=689 RepID=A0ABX5DC85_9VIBR|nr:hypothetical protein [Vibrio mediterranei]PCD87693.1 hypothetical protein COR52_14940 [Vibrio mediterranei]PRQ67317.1 hypothetical protein COR51_12125 [Vibrio mediterranei]